jgi:hypothetical protein
MAGYLFRMVWMGAPARGGTHRDLSAFRLANMIGYHSAFDLEQKNHVLIHVV